MTSIGETAERPIGLAGRTLVLGLLVALLWAVEAVDQWWCDGALDAHGIRPRSGSGLWGILFAPFLHSDFEHLAANTVPLLVLGWVVLLRGLALFFEVTALVMLVGGLGTWLIGPARSVHIGASGLVFGYLGYLLLRGVFERSLRSVVIAVLVGVVYGGLLWGILPAEPGVSWQGHLWGFVGGVLCARLAGRPPG